MRTTLIQLAWLWLRNQPQSALALWFKDWVSRNGGRLKKTTIVALARKLLVALWKYVTAGPPEPRLPQAGYWCSRFARRPNVRLIWCGNDQIMETAQTLDTETATGVSLMRD